MVLVMAHDSQKMLVLGIGNMLLTDDGVGVLAAQELQKESWPENITILDGGTFTQDLFYLFEQYDTLLILDVVHAGHEPGTLYTLTEQELIQKEHQRLSIHDIDLLDSLRMCALKSGHAPTLRILGMEPHDISTWNIGLSKECASKFPQFVALARREITAFLATTD